MAGEPDEVKREALAENFFDHNRFRAKCVGIFEEPLWPVLNLN
jgi:hypothetical protein